ncbi:phage tail assembly protein [Shewanella algae]|uniref:phage tail assembly protein n=1 Tax=Shewanella algae TaxID=38313 RepID=UPI0031F5A080
MKMTFDLQHGLALGEGDEQRIYTAVTLRELTAGDLIDAAIEAEQVRQVAEGGRTRYVTVRSEELFSLALLGKQIASIGAIQGPISLQMLKRLQADDLLLLSRHANGLDGAALEDVTARGRMDGTGGED